MPDVWYGWTTGATTNSTTGIMVDTTWSNWALSTGAVTLTNCVTTSSSTAWQGWNIVAGTGTVVMHNNRLPSEEERRHRRRRNCIEQAKAKSARLKARQLLESLLDDEQRTELVDKHTITLRSRSGRRFCLDARKRGHNALELDEQGRRIREFCIHAPHHIPQDDHLAAQVLMLRTEEEEFDRIANVWNLRPDGGHGTFSRSGQHLVPA